MMDIHCISPAEEAKKYVKEYWDGMPDEAPSEYSRPDCDPYLVEIDSEIAKTWKKKKSLRF